MSNDFGTASEVRAIRRLARRLQKAIRRANAGEFDGEEFGQGEAVLYMYGRNKDELWAAIEPTLRNLTTCPAYAHVRTGGPDVEPERVDL